MRAPRDHELSGDEIAACVLGLVRQLHDDANGPPAPPQAPHNPLAPTVRHCAYCTAWTLHDRYCGARCRRLAANRPAEVLAS